MPEQILIIEDESAIAENIVYALQTEGYQAHWRAQGGEGLALLLATSIDLVILDVGLPDTNGFVLAREIRQRSAVPIIFVTARGEEVDRVVGLEIGGDDYVVKPFSPRELTARVRAVLRRVSAPTSAVGSCRAEAGHPLQVDEARRLITVHGRPLDLVRYEYLLLKLFIAHPGRVFTRDQLMERVWDTPDMSLERTVDTHVKTLRQKLRALAPQEEWIVTHRGVGYSLKAGQ